MEDASLGSRREFHLQCVVILPGDAQAPRLPHDADGAIAFALFAGRFVLCRIPGVGDSKGFDTSGNTVIVALSRSDHPILPILGNHRDPGSGDIDCGCSLRCLRSLWAALASLSVTSDGHRTRQEYKNQIFDVHSFLIYLFALAVAP